MEIFAAAVLFVNALFNVVVWPRFYPRIANDARATDAHGKRTAFYRVHVILIASAIVLAAVSVVAGVLVLL
ncbi:hypothetical protein RZO50_03460 [Microbacterium sp. SSW1-59]|uniref:SCO4848 family membrane protein n=1 Tax=Microbacterium xanthum TaxID=3079794 RepID=UPI002AD501B8|nr:hypothetical protein [Microbacterium sp. SSW1-59]MDZ8200554.1 hypothetical protein [Microbacterium sp. SSW1-59]